MIGDISGANSIYIITGKTDIANLLMTHWTIFCAQNYIAPMPDIIIWKILTGVAAMHTSGDIL